MGGDWGGRGKTAKTFPPPLQTTFIAEGLVEPGVGNSRSAPAAPLALNADWGWRRQSTFSAER